MRRASRAAVAARKEEWLAKSSGVCLGSSSSSNAAAGRLRQPQNDCSRELRGTATGEKQGARKYVPVSTAIGEIGGCEMWGAENTWQRGKRKTR